MVVVELIEGEAVEADTPEEGGLVGRKVVEVVVRRLRTLLGFLLKLELPPFGWK